MNAGQLPRELEGTAAIVTGSTGLRGRDIALALADAGAMVVVNGRSSAEAAEAVVRKSRRVAVGQLPISRISPLQIKPKAWSIPL